MIAVSICGGITHNLGRILVAMVVVKNYYIFGYFPSFCRWLDHGTLIGLLAQEIYTRTKHFIR